VTASASLGREHRVLLEDRVELPRLYMAWHSPAMFAPGDAEMDLLSDVLANGKTSRLYRALVYERRVAVDVSAFQGSRELSGYFLLSATAAPGQSLADLASIIDRELQLLLDDGPSESELERGQAQAESQFVYRLQTVGGFGGKSDQLNAYNVWCGDPGHFDTDLQRYRSVTRDSLRDAGRRWLRADQRVLLSAVPRGAVASALPGSEPSAVA
jgi:zinc protease